MKFIQKFLGLAPWGQRSSPVIREKVVLSAANNDGEFHLLRIALAETAIPIQIYRVTNGEDVLAFLGKSGVFKDALTPSLILLDVDMPGLDGFEVIRLIKSQPALAAIPIVMFTSSDDKFEKQRALALGASEFITKSFTFRQCLDDVKTICAGYL
jgi:CheY-like chemotaxis protein